MTDTTPRSERTTDRVGYMLRMYPRFTQTFVVNEILELERQGFGVGILSLRKPADGRFHESISRVRALTEYVPERFGESRVKILRALRRQCQSGAKPFLRAAAAVGRYAGADLTDFHQAAMALRWAKKRKLKHVHVHFGTHEASVAYLASIMGDFSYSLTLHAFDIFRDNVDRPLLAMKINASRFTVTVSEFNRAFMLRNLPGVNPERIRVNYNGVDTDLFRMNGAARTPNTVLSVGRLIEKKGFIHLVRAAGKLRDRGLEVKCTIVGDGPQEPQLRAEIKKLKLHDAVTLAGPRSQADVREMMSRSACFVLPCVHAADGNVDALPTVLLEAMASGCPCVSTTISGVPEIIEHETSGVLVPPEDDVTLANATMRVLKDAEYAESLSRAGRRRAESVFDIRTNVRIMASWFRDMVRAEESAGVRSMAARVSPVGQPAVECGP